MLLASHAAPMPLTHVGLIYGGRSAEHDVAAQSARNVFRALTDRPTAAYRVTPLYIDRAGHWHVEDADAARLHAPEALAVVPSSEPGPSAGVGPVEALELDVAVPMLHGQNGEDGRIQGLLRALDLPFVGADVLASAACMDKEVTKRLLRDAGLPIVPFQLVRRGEAADYGALTEALGHPIFVKPANSGSSVGTAKVADADSFQAAVADAFRYDHKVLVEPAVPCREIEVAILGNLYDGTGLRAAVPGEIVSAADFYTYEAKYLDADAARMQVPADLPADLAEQIRTLALDAARALGCEGLARVDCFLADDGAVYVNEINTIPGFTARSMYPVMWAESGLPLPTLLDTLIELAFERHERDDGLSFRM